MSILFVSFLFFLVHLFCIFVSGVSNIFLKNETYPLMFISMVYNNNCVQTNDYSYKVKLLTTLVEGDPKAPFSIATTPRYRGGNYYSIP